MESYDPINWQVPTLIKGAYTVIDGVEYPVYMPSYDGKTPVNVTNLGKMDNALAFLFENMNFGELPVGAITIFPGTVAPENYLLCDDSIYSKTQYPELYDVLGSEFQISTDTFRVPNLKGKTIIGYDSSDTDFDEIGKIGGSKEHSHTTNLQGTSPYQTELSGLHYINASIEDGVTTKSYESSSESNLPPYVTLNFIIKAKKSEASGQIESLSLKIAELQDELEASQLTNAVEGDTINITDSANTAVKQVVVSGKSSQQSTPSPTSPQEIESINSYNLFDKENVNVINGYIQPSTGKILGSSNDKCLYVSIEGGKTYTVSKILSGIFRIGFTDSLPAINSTCNPLTYDNNVQSLTLKSNASNNYLVVDYFVNNNPAQEQDILNSIVIEEGSIAHDYMPYKTAISIKSTQNIQQNIVNVDLDENEARSAGNVEDQVILKNKNAKLIQKTGKIILDGSSDENYLYVSNNSVNGYSQINYRNKIDNIDNSNSGSNVICSHFKYYVSAHQNIKQDQGIRIVEASTPFVFSIPETLANSVETFRSWLSQNPVTIVYGTTDEVEVDLGASTMPRTYKNTTNITLSAKLDTTMNLTYVQDINTVIQNLMSSSSSVIVEVN